jgi:hypothetical protein
MKMFYMRLDIGKLQLFELSECHEWDRFAIQARSQFNWLPCRAKSPSPDSEIECEPAALF